jgi:hypothetical protein
MPVSDGTVLRLVSSLLFPDSAIAQNVFNVVFTDSGGSNDVVDVLDDLETYIEDIYALMNSVVVSGIALDSLKIYEYDAPEDDWDQIGERFPTDGFAAAGNPLPNGVAVLVHAYTTNPDVIGGKYFGGFPPATTVDNDCEAGLITAVANAADEWVAPFVGAETGADFAPVVWSPTKTTPLPFNLVIAVNGQVAYQRRRKPGVGI